MPKPARQRTSDGRSTLQRTVETRAVEFLTVGWMVSMMTTLACLVVYAILRSYVALRADAEQLAALAALVLFAAVVTGVLTLLLTSIVVRMRREKPPRGVVWFAMVVGVVPLVIVLVRAMRG